MAKSTYVCAGTKPWNRRIFEEVIAGFPGAWHYVADAAELTEEKLAAWNPRYVFFLHWSEKIPPETFDKFECVTFHMTDVPYGRGGSPLQNLIVRGHRSTRLTALRTSAKFDAGPVYLKEELSLEGTAEEIYIRATRLSAMMIKTIIEKEPVPVPQTGEPVVFKRRKPEQSAIPQLPDLQSLHDFIRMLDAEDYPKAFIEHEGFRYEFSRAGLYEGRIVADVAITPARKGGQD